MAHILHIDLHDFLVAVERKHDPSLIGRPLVIGGQPTGWGRVVAVSQEAADRGVKPGMSLSVAASRCPSAIFRDGAFDRYLDASAAIDERLREPGVPVEWTSIDSVFLDLTPRGAGGRGGASGPGVSGGTGGANGPTSRDAALRHGAIPRAGQGAPRQIAERLQSALRDQLGFETACGIASTKIAAQIASRLARPAGLLYVLPGYEERLMAPLDVGMLPDLPATLVPRLQRMGVLTLGHLASMDLLVAEGLLGHRAAEFARFARGLDERAVDGTAPPRSVARDVTLPQPTQSPAELESVTQYLTETLAGRLRRMSCFAQTITVRLRGGSPERTVARSTTLREATATDADLVAAAHGLLHLLRRAGVSSGAAASSGAGVGTAGVGAARVGVASGRIAGGSLASGAGRDLSPADLAGSSLGSERLASGSGADGLTSGGVAGRTMAVSSARQVTGISVVLSNLHQGGAQLPLFPLSPAATRDTWTDLRGRAGFRALVHGRFATEPAAGARRAG